MAQKESMTTKNTEELMKLLGEMRAELRSVRFAAAGTRAKDTNVAKKLRATIARIMTEMRHRALAA